MTAHEDDEGQGPDSVLPPSMAGDSAESYYNLQGTMKRQGEHEHLRPWRRDRQSVVEAEFLHLARGTSLGIGKNPNTHH